MRSGLRRLRRRSYSVYGPSLSWAETTPVAPPPAFDLPELVDADRLVQSRNHLQSDNALSCLNRALLIAERVHPSLSESVLSRIAFIHQQRGDYHAEIDALAALLKLESSRANLWKGAVSIAKYRCEQPVNLACDSIRDLAIDGVLRRSSSSIAEAIAKLEGCGSASSFGALQLLNGWVFSQMGNAVDAVASLQASINSLVSVDVAVHAPILFPSRLLLAQCQGLAHSEARATLERTLHLCDEVGLSDSDPIKIDTIRILSECYAYAGDAIVAEGLLRSALSSLSRLSFLSASELDSLERLRHSYAALLRGIEWNGVKRTRDAERILIDGQGDYRRCPYRTQPCSDKFPDWVVQILVAD